MASLHFMGVGEPEVFRARVYQGEASRSQNEIERRAFVQRLATTGVIDCPAYDEWIVSLDRRGWVTYRMEPNTNGPGQIKRWLLTTVGRAAWEEMR